MHISKKILAIAAASLLGALTAFPVSAETISGKLERTENGSIVGWAWDKDDFDHILNVELHIFPAGSDTEIKTATVKADHYRDDLHDSIGDGYHGFLCPIDWTSLNNGDFTITAYAVSENGKTPLKGIVSYKNDNQEIGPGVTGSSSVSTQTASGKKGVSLGIFTTSGYCSCEKCSGGHNLTYSGTVPQAEHTISADLTLLPLNTKVMINDVIYTVEDMGSSVDGNRIDIFYGSHEEALAHGVQEEEVFLVEES